MADKFLKFDLGSAFLGRNLAYIYILCSKKLHILYVGQTNDRGGVMSRLGSHLAEKGTFRGHLLSREIEIEDIDDLQVFAFVLPDASEYLSASQTHREGVEYCVQTRLLSVGAKWAPYFRIVSTVRAPKTTELQEVNDLAQWICDTLDNLYHGRESTLQQGNVVIVAEGTA